MGNNAHNDIHWFDVPFFLALSRAQTLAGAARLIDVDRTTVARRIDAMESRLGAQVFERLDGRFVLTALGRKLFSAAERAEHELGLSNSNEDKRSKVRLSLPEQFGTSLVKSLQRFEAIHPQILLEVSTSDHFSSLKRYEADVALRVSRTKPRDLYYMDLGPLQFGLYVARSQVGTTRRYISYPGRDTIPDNVLKIVPDAEIVMSVDGYMLIREFVAAGFGSAILPVHMVEADPRLLCIGALKQIETFNLYLVCLPEQRGHFRVQMLMRHLKTELNKTQAQRRVSPDVLRT